MSRHAPAIVSTTLALFLSLSPATARAQAERGDWELTLAATGSSNNDFNQHAIGVNVSIGYFFLNDFELSLRQLGTYSKTQDDSAANGATMFAFDLVFPLGRRREWQPFIGANAGYFYGDTFTDTFEYAPEAGLRYFANSTTFIFFRVEYNIFAKDFTGNSDSADRQWTSTLGIGLRF